MIDNKPMPKFSFDKTKRKYVALKEFTDREKPFETFKKNIDKLTNNLKENKEELQVLVYYGVGGIGKSSLKNKLKELTLSISDSTRLEVDFKDVKNIEAGRGLRELIESSENLNKSLKIPFRHFELAYALYFKKKNPDYLFTKDNDKLLDKFDLGMEVLGMLDPFGIVGICSILVEKMYKFSGKLLLNKDVVDSLKEFDELPLNEIEERLQAYFAYDIKQYMSEHKNHKVFIFMDTFEILSEYETHELKRNENVKWIKELIADMPNVLFVIFGREKLYWGNDWDKYLEQHLLSELPLDFADKFLVKCGIEEENIRKKILNISSGHPYYLDLSVDTYFAVKNSGGEISESNFGNSQKEILERFIYNLNLVEIETLKVISIPNFYDRELFRIIVTKLNIPYPVTQFHSFNQYSFISTTDNKYFYIHKLMRTGMLEYIDEELKKNTHMIVFEYYDKLFEHDKSQNFLECVYHKINIESKDDFFLWLSNTKLDYMKECQVMGQTVLLSLVFKLIVHYYPVEEFDINLFNIYEDIVHLAGNYQASVNIAEKYLSKYTEEQILMNKDLIRLKFRIIHHKMFFVPVDILIDELLKIKDSVDKNLYFEEYCEILYMLGGTLGTLSGNFEVAQKWLLETKHEIENSGINNKALNNIMKRVLRKTIDCMRAQGKYEDALKLCFTYESNDNLDRYLIYLQCTIGETLRGICKYEEAIEYFSKVLSSTKVLGIKGWTAHANLAMANTYLELKDYNTAKTFMDQAYGIYNELEHQWGIINSNLMDARINISESGDLNSNIDKLMEISEACNKYNYTYENFLIGEIIKNNDIGHQQLMFI